jgi:hypothetical protein
VANGVRVAGNTLSVRRFSRRAQKDKDNGQSWLKTAALNKAQEIVGSRWRIYEELEGNLVWPVVAAVVFWLVGAFFSIGVIMPRNWFAFAGLFVGVLSVSIAMYLIIELSYPYDGMITISTQPLEEAVAEIAAPAEPG